MSELVGSKARISALARLHHRQVRSERPAIGYRAEPVRLSEKSNARCYSKRRLGNGQPSGLRG